MARIALTVQTPTRAGLSPTFTAANTDGHYFNNDGRTILRLKNTSGSPVVATVTLGGTTDGVSLGTLGKSVTIPATTGDVTTAVWPRDAYDQPDGTVYVNYASTTGVTIAALSV